MTQLIRNKSNTGGAKVSMHALVVRRVMVEVKDTNEHAVICMESFL